MKRNGKNGGWEKLILPVALFIIIKVFSFFPSLVEDWYSSKLYPIIAVSLRWLTGWLPFSFGDVLYTVAVIWILVRIYKTIKAVIKKKVTKTTFLHSFRRTLVIVLWIYILFNFLWGLNYERLGIAYQLKLETGEYGTPELKTLTSSLIDKANAERLQLGDSSFTYPLSKEIFKQAKEAYDSAEKKYPFLNYSGFSIKSSLYGKFGNYAGFLGYYNPFTGESQVNTRIPGFLIPYTTCHEIGHQVPKF